MLDFSKVLGVLFVCGMTVYVVGWELRYTDLKIAMILFGVACTAGILSIKDA